MMRSSLAMALMVCMILPLGMAADPSHQVMAVVDEAGDAQPSAADGAKLDIDDVQTLTQMLHWSLEHQDLDALHEKAEAIRKAGARAALPEGNGGPRIVRAEASAPGPSASLDDLARAMDSVMPDQAQLMRDALHVALQGAQPVDAVHDDGRPVRRVDALLALQELVEDLDNARDFERMGGFSQLLPLLAEPCPSIVAHVRRVAQRAGTPAPHPTGSRLAPNLAAADRLGPRHRRAEQRRHPGAPRGCRCACWAHRTALRSPRAGARLAGTSRARGRGTVQGALCPERT